MNDELAAYYRDREEHTVQLAEAQLEEQEAFDEAEEALDPALVCWANINGHVERCRVLTGFTCAEFMELLGYVEDAIPTVIGRGRRSRLVPADRFLLLLCYLKHYETHAKIGDTFHVSKTQIQRIVDTTLAAVTPLLYSRFVENITDLIDYEPVEGEFSEAKYVMDATIQEIWTPLGTYEERKRYYSGKHKLYGLKTQTLHLRNGISVATWSGIPGAVHDLTITRDKIDEVSQPINKILIK